MQQPSLQTETKKKCLKIVIPEINDEIFEKRIIDGIPTINKPIKCKSAYEFWKDLEENDKEIESPSKKIKTK